MPEVTVSIGRKSFTVACQDGEEAYLQSAAEMLDREATAMVDQIGRLPEVRMLLMAGLMLADRTAAFEERALAAEEKLLRQEKLIEEMGTVEAPEPKRIEVPVIPAAVTDSLTDLAEQAEAIAADLEERAGLEEGAGA